MEVLDGMNAIVIQPTRSGKSLCCQLPPFAGVGTAVVISPTLSLIDDQVGDVPERDSCHLLVFYTVRCFSAYCCSKRTLQGC